MPDIIVPKGTPTLFLECIDHVNAVGNNIVVALHISIPEPVRNRFGIKIALLVKGCYIKRHKEVDIIVGV